MNTFSWTDAGIDRSVSYVEYYEKKYSTKIYDVQQPLLVHHNERTGQDIHLIPE